MEYVNLNNFTMDESYYIDTIKNRLLRDKTAIDDLYFIYPMLKESTRGQLNIFISKNKEKIFHDRKPRVCSNNIIIAKAIRFIKDKVTIVGHVDDLDDTIFKSLSEMIEDINSLNIKYTRLFTSIIYQSVTDILKLSKVINDALENFSEITYNNNQAELNFLMYDLLPYKIKQYEIIMRFTKDKDADNIINTMKDTTYQGLISSIWNKCISGESSKEETVYGIDTLDSLIHLKNKESILKFINPEDLDIETEEMDVPEPVVPFKLTKISENLIKDLFNINDSFKITFDIDENSIIHIMKDLKVPVQGNYFKIDNSLFFRNYFVFKNKRYTLFKVLPSDKIYAITILDSDHVRLYQITLNKDKEYFLNEMEL